MIDKIMLKFIDWLAYKLGADTPKKLAQLSKKIYKISYLMIGNPLYGVMLYLAKDIRNDLSDRMARDMEMIGGPNFIRENLKKTRTIHYTTSIAVIVACMLGIIGQAYFLEKGVHYLLPPFYIMLSVQYTMCNLSDLIMHADYNYKPPMKKAKEPKESFAGVMPA